MSKFKKALFASVTAITVSMTSGAVIADNGNGEGAQMYNPEADIRRIKSIGEEFVRFNSSDSYNLDTIYNFAKDTTTDRSLDPYTRISMEYFKDKMREQAFIMKNLDWEYDDRLNKLREERGVRSTNNGYKLDGQGKKYWTVDNYLNPYINEVQQYRTASGKSEFYNINEFARYMVFEGDSPKNYRFPPQWAARAIVDWLPRAQDCIVVAWADRKYPKAARKAKNALQDIANYAVRIQINNDFLTDSLSYPARVTQDTMIVPSQIRHEAAQLSKKLYPPYLKGIDVCLSEEIRLTANAIRSCNPEYDICDCYIEGEPGLKRLSTPSFTVSDETSTRTFKAYPYTIDGNINQQVCKSSTMGGGFDSARSTWFHSCPDYMSNLMCHCDEPDAGKYSQCWPDEVTGG
jgi:hypothetical protein